VALTGSTEVGRRVQQLASGTIKKVTLELGGKSANIISTTPTSRWRSTARSSAASSTRGRPASRARVSSSRESCTTSVSRLVERTRQLTIGDPMDFGRRRPAHLRAPARDGAGYIKAGVDEGAKVAVGGKRPEHLAKGYYVEPHHLRRREELDEDRAGGDLRPGALRIRYKNIDDAIRMANDSIYGLGGAVWSRDKAKALEVAKQMRTGTVWINDYHLLSVAAPFAAKAERHRPRVRLEGILEYTEVKHVHVDQVDNRPAKFWYGALFGA